MLGLRLASRWRFAAAMGFVIAWTLGPLLDLPNAAAQGCQPVSIKGVGGNPPYQPSSFSIDQGGCVTWKNNDTTTHTATSTSGPASFDTGNLGPGQSSTKNFAASGTYNYKCNFHASMTASFEVKGAPSPPPPSPSPSPPPPPPPPPPPTGGSTPKASPKPAASPTAPQSATQAPQPPVESPTEASPSPVESPTPSPTRSPEVTELATEEDEGDPGLIAVWVIAGVLAVGGAGAGFWFFRRSRAR